MYNGIIFIILVVIGFFVCKKNYYSRTNSFTKNLDEFSKLLVIKYESISIEKRKDFFNTLNSKEYNLFHNVIEGKFNLNNNLSDLQTSMYILEDISRKLKAFED